MVVVTTRMILLGRSLSRRLDGLRTPGVVRPPNQVPTESCRVLPRSQSFLSNGIQREFHQSSYPSKETNKNASRDTRLAGRIRFYKQVDVISVAPPWEIKTKEYDGNDTSKETTIKQNEIESPISAGVDGTQSASGVHHVDFNDMDPLSMEYMLTPRVPGRIEPKAATTTDSTKNPIQWYGITLDGRGLKTPMGHTLALPSQQLAFAIAAEWDAQAKYLQPAQMPLMTLACTSLDQVAINPHVYREQALSYLPTDTTCFWADPTEDRVLHRRQEQAWSALHTFVEKRFQHAPAFATGAHEGMIMARKRPNKPKSGLPHPPKLYELATEWTYTLDSWHLMALHAICTQAKSFLVALAMLEYNHPDSPFQLDVKKAIAASRVEEEFQISNWGLVEGGHDYDRLNCSIQLHAAQVLARTIALENNL